MLFQSYRLGKYVSEDEVIYMSPFTGTIYLRHRVRREETAVENCSFMQKIVGNGNVKITSNLVSSIDFSEA